MKEIKNWTNVEFPLKTRYIRHTDRLYLSSDFKDGEILIFYSKCEKPIGNALGYRLYLGERSRVPKLIRYDNIEWN